MALAVRISAMSAARFGPVGRPPESQPRCGPWACAPGLRSRPAAPNWAARIDRNRRPIRSEACTGGAGCGRSGMPTVGMPPSRAAYGTAHFRKPPGRLQHRGRSMTCSVSLREADSSNPLPRRGHPRLLLKPPLPLLPPHPFRPPWAPPGGAFHHSPALVLLAGFHVSGCRRALPSVTGALGGYGRLAQPWRTGGRQRRLSPSGMALRSSAAAARTAGARGSSARAGRRIPSSVAAGGNAPTNLR